MKLLRIVLVAIVLLLGLPFVIGLSMSSEWDVSSSVVIPAERIWVQYTVDDPSRWPQWNRLCPPAETVKSTGEAHQAGAFLTAENNGVNARWEITENTLGERVVIRRSQGEAVVGTSELTMRSVEGGTEVTYRDHGDLGGNPIARLFGSAVRARLRENVEKSLPSLKTLVLTVEKEEPEMLGKLKLAGEGAPKPEDAPPQDR